MRTVQSESIFVFTSLLANPVILSLLTQACGITARN